MNANNLPRRQKNRLILRSRSSDALVKAANEIRRRHQNLLLEAGKKERSSNPSSTLSSSTSLHREEGDSNVAFDAHQVLKVELTSEIRRRRSDLSNSRNRTISLPASRIYRSLSSLSQFEGSLDDDNASIHSYQTPANRVDRSSSLLASKKHQKLLCGIRELNAQSRKQDEAMAAVEKMRYSKIMEMYEKFFEKTDSTKRSSLDGDLTSQPRLFRSDSATSNGVSSQLRRNDSRASSLASNSVLSQETESKTCDKNNHPRNNIILHTGENDGQGIIQMKDLQPGENSEEIKQKINELETQISRATSEFEMERALMEVKITAENKCLAEEESNCEKIKVKIIELEEDYIAKREKYHDEIQDKNSKLQGIQDKISETERQIEKSPESLREFMAESLNKDLEKMKEEMKYLEDAEFSMLEKMSNFDEEKEKLQRNLILEKKRLDFRINNRKNRIKMLQNQLADLERKEKQENQRLFQDRDAAIGMLQEHQQQKNSSLESDTYQKQALLGSGFPTPSPGLNRQPSSKSRRLMSLESFLDSISLLEKSESSNQKSTDKWIEPSNLSSVSSVRLRHPRRSLNFSESGSKYQLLKEPENSSDQSQMKRLNLKDSRASLVSVESIGSSMSASVEDERLREMKRLLAEAQAKKEILLHDINLARNSLHHSPPTSPNYEDTTDLKAENGSKTKESQISLVALRSSTKKRQNRPMSRYLPNRSSDFNLREHIEGCGHNPISCRHVVLTDTCCSGYLSKKGGKLRSWKKKWFVFDRVQKMLFIYSDKREIKEKGKIPFESIEDVFIDHLKSHKSPNPSFTFCMKCSDRFHFFSAPSSDAMSIWMDVLVTGAEGYREYMKTIDRTADQKK